MKESVKTYTLKEATKALEFYCAYQDRCHKEVEEKLSSMRLIPDFFEPIISHLIAEKFLNETRFAQSFARGKFRIKKWGKTRIIRELKQRNISEYNIKKGLQEIDEVAYLECLENIVEKKMETVLESNPFKKKKKIIEYLMRLGYENSLIYTSVDPYFRP